MNEFNRNKINESSSKPSDSKIITDINEITTDKMYDTSSQKKFSNDAKKYKITIHDEINGNKKNRSCITNAINRTKKHMNEICFYWQMFQLPP